MAGETAVFMDHLSPAIRAGAHNFFIVFYLGLSIIADHPADGIRAGQDLVPVTPGRRRATNTGDLLHYGRQTDPGPQGQGDQSPGGLNLGGGTTAGFPHLGENLADSFLVGIDGDIQFTAAGGDAFGNPQGPRGTGSGIYF